MYCRAGSACALNEPNPYVGASVCSVAEGGDEAVHLLPNLLVHLTGEEDEEGRGKEERGGGMVSADREWEGEEERAGGGGRGLREAHAGRQRTVANESSRSSRHKGRTAQSQKGVRN